MQIEDAFWLPPDWCLTPCIEWSGKTENTSLKVVDFDNQSICRILLYSTKSERVIGWHTWNITKPKPSSFSSFLPHGNSKMPFTLTGNKSASENGKIVCISQFQASDLKKCQIFFSFVFFFVLRWYELGIAITFTRCWICPSKCIYNMGCINVSIKNINIIVNHSCYGNFHIDTRIVLFQLYCAFHL